MANFDDMTTEQLIESIACVESEIARVKANQRQSNNVVGDMAVSVLDGLLGDLAQMNKAKNQRVQQQPNNYLRLDEGVIDADWREL